MALTVCPSEPEFRADPASGGRLGGLFFPVEILFLPVENSFFLLKTFFPVNRKKSNSPFIEYPLNRLDTVIQALQELKETVIRSGHYKEQDVLNCKYPENTRLRPKDDKDTILETMS